LNKKNLIIYFNMRTRKEKLIAALASLITFITFGLFLLSVSVWLQPRADWALHPNRLYLEERTSDGWQTIDTIGIETYRFKVKENLNTSSDTLHLEWYQPK